MNFVLFFQWDDVRNGQIIAAKVILPKGGSFWVPALAPFVCLFTTIRMFEYSHGKNVTKYKGMSDTCLTSLRPAAGKVDRTDGDFGGWEGGREGDFENCLFYRMSKWGWDFAEEKGNGELGTLHRRVDWGYGDEEK